MIEHSPQHAWRSEPGRWHGEWQRSETGSGVAIIFNETDEIGFSPALHRHPHAETFIVRKGRVRFVVDGKVMIAGEGDILMAPANAPDMIGIHASPTFIAEWL